MLTGHEPAKMSVDLQKHRDAIVAAWKSVCDRKCATNWALFGYEGQTNVLKVQETGEDGISELAAELNSGKIQYAFLRVDNSETGIAKFVFINWQVGFIHYLKHRLNHLARARAAVGTRNLYRKTMKPRYASLIML